MALSQQEFEKLKLQLSANNGSMPVAPSQNFGVKDVATGAVKGLLDTTIGTSKMLQGAGQRIIAGIDPTRNLEQVRQQTGFPSLQGLKAKQIDDQLKAKNTGEKVGKALEFTVGLLYPVGRAEEVANLVNKGEKVIGANLDGIGSRLSSLKDDVLPDGTNIKDKVSDLIFKLDDRTKTALKRTPIEKFKETVEQGKAALIDDKNRTPLELVGDDIIDGLKQIKDRATSIAEQKSAHLDQAKIGLKRTGNIVRDALLDTKKVFSQMKLDTSDKRLIQEFFDELKTISQNPTLKEVDRTIDLLQDKLYKTSNTNAVEITNRIVGPLRNILGQLNSKVGDIGGDAYKKYNSDYKELIEVVEELNARVGREGGGAGAFVKRLFSPSDARTKYLFEQLEKFTGKDYFRDARLAKFVMDSLDDVRADSILNQIPRSPSGVVEKVIDYGAKKLQDPIKKAEKFIQKK